MKATALIIFVKNPVRGKVKTRLAKTIGDKAALNIYTQLLLHTYNVAINCPADKFVFYGDFINHDDLWSHNHFEKYLQHGNDLGERMANAFDVIFEQGYKKAAIIGSDNFEIEVAHLAQAFECLNEYNTVIGPAHDGGYYLLGMQQLYKPLFENKDWSTPLLLQQTFDDISRLHLSCKTIETLNDVDDEQDLQHASRRKKIHMK